MEHINIAVDAGKPAKPFKHFYNAVGYANVDYTYTEPSRTMYDYLSSYHKHFKYMRLHNILTAHGKGDYYLVNHGMDYGNPPEGSKRNSKFAEGGDSVAALNGEGKLVFDWTIVDKVYDIMIQHHIKPIVETVYMPHCIQKSAEEWFIPRDYNLWKELLIEFVKHLEERYGREEVEQWYFEVWNEPDNHSLWVENSETFLALYDYMEAAVHSVNPKIKVGGPAVKQGEGAFIIFKRFLEHCSKGLNYVTGKFGTPVDFISVHCKGGWPEGYNPSSEVMFNSIKEYLDILKEYPEYKDTEFFNDESDIVWHGNLGIWKNSWLNFRNTHYAPGFICKMVNNYCQRVEDEYGVKLSMVDSDNCHIQWERFLFSGNRSQLTPLVKYGSSDLIKKPIFNAYVLLSRLGTERLQAECGNEDFGRKFGVLPTSEGDMLSVMVWNFEDGVEEEVNYRKIQVQLKNLQLKGKYRLLHYRIDSEHSSSYNQWKKLGKPENPSLEQIKSIREKEGLELYEEVKDVNMEENMNFTLLMPMHSVSLLLLVPENEEEPSPAAFIKAEVQKGFNGNPQVFLKWTPSEEKDFLYYKVFRKKKNEENFSLLSCNGSLNTALYIDMEAEKGICYEYAIQAVNASYKESRLSKPVQVEIL